MRGVYGVVGVGWYDVVSRIGRCGLGGGCVMCDWAVVVVVVWGGGGLRDSGAVRTVDYASESGGRMWRVDCGGRGYVRLCWGVLVCWMCVAERASRIE